MLRLFLHQMNPTVGAMQENAILISRGIKHARELRSDIYISPECALCGYPPEDLLLTPSFLKANRRLLTFLASETKGITAIIGFPYHDGDLYNAAAVFFDGELRGIVKKSILPNYGVFDENRYFQEGEKPVILKVDGTSIGVTVCEDIWYPSGPARHQALWGGAHLIINISASPYSVGKSGMREKMLSTRAADNGVYLAFCNMVGGQDEIVFDGSSAVFAPDGSVIAKALPFEEDFVVADVFRERVDLHRLKDPRRRVALRSEPEGELEVIGIPEHRAPLKSPLPAREIGRLCEEEEVYRALVLGCRDYAAKNGFKKALLGLSGGVDSALTASIAVDALGAGNVVGVTMPSRYSSEGSRKDSEELASNLGIEFMKIPIEKPFASFLETLSPHMDPAGVVEENLQARVRGVLLMALSNKHNWLLLSTGNKSETSVGYCTLYGDMAGGFSLLKDVPKTLVYSLSCWRNKEAGRPWIPAASIEKPPSAELRPDQLDSDSLPPYEVLDPILKTLVEEEGDLADTIKRYGKDTVARVAALLYANEYKRRQAPPGVKISPRAFGKDRRFPITNRYKRF